MTDRRMRGLRSLVRGRPGTGQESPERSMDPRSAGDGRPVPPRSRVIDNAIYVNGHRAATPGSLPEAFERLKNTPDSMAWIGFYRPEDGGILNVAEEFDLHELAVEDADRRPPAARSSTATATPCSWCSAPARYLDEAEEVEFGELHVFVGQNFVITVRHSESPDLSQVRRRMQHDPELLGQGPRGGALRHPRRGRRRLRPRGRRPAERHRRDRGPGLRRRPGVSRRIYELSREVIEFQRATQPLPGMIERLHRAGSTSTASTRSCSSYLRDVADHAITRRRAGRAASGCCCTTSWSVNATLVAQRQNEEIRNLTEASIAQNEEVKKISAWAAILFAPTLVGTVYGMNFDVMPEMHWQWGYPFAVLLMAGVCLTLYLVFKRRDWL